MAVKEDRRMLLHILKNNPQNGEVYITWEGETFVGQIRSLQISAAVDTVTEFDISGYIVNKRN
jgi:hypothetical protein